MNDRYLEIKPDSLACAPTTRRALAPMNGNDNRDREGSDVVRAAGGLVWRDSPRGKELVIIHRKRYDDWTLPKGKLQLDESWRDAALRQWALFLQYHLWLDSPNGS